VEGVPWRDQPGAREGDRRCREGKWKTIGQHNTAQIPFHPQSRLHTIHGRKCICILFMCMCLGLGLGLGIGIGIGKGNG
jgi:hypothetical protein